MSHRWSGWPGAYCLDCGTEDQTEICMATSCDKGFINCSCRDGCGACDGTGVQCVPCPDHVNKPCPSKEVDDE